MFPQLRPMRREAPNRRASIDGMQPQQCTITKDISTSMIATARSKRLTNLSSRSEPLAIWCPLRLMACSFPGRISMLDLVSLRMRLCWELLMMRMLRLTRAETRICLLRALLRQLRRPRHLSVQLARLLHRQPVGAGLVRLTTMQRVVRPTVSRS